MKTIPKNDGLSQANHRAALRAREIGKKMQADTLKKAEQKKAKKKAAEEDDKK